MIVFFLPKFAARSLVESICLRSFDHQTKPLSDPRKEYPFSEEAEDTEPRNKADVGWQSLNFELLVLSLPFLLLGEPAADRTRR